MNNVRIFPSILTLDFSDLRNQILEAEENGASGIHIDVMDGQFVPPITFGTPIIEAVRKVTSLPLDVHMMVIEPHRHFGQLVESGADSITFHIEAVDNPIPNLETLGELGVGRSIALNPGTGTEVVIPFLHRLDQVLLMSVEPGYGGQKFIEQTVSKIALLKTEIRNRSLPVQIQVDGGINKCTLLKISRSGADVAVAGSAIFNHSFCVSEGLKSLIEIANS